MIVIHINARRMMQVRTKIKINVRMMMQVMTDIMIQGRMYYVNNEASHEKKKGN